VKPRPKTRRTRKARWFVIPGVLMLVIGVGLMLSCAFGGRLSADQALPLPLGFTTAATGAMLLTRSPLAIFFLAIYSTALLGLGIHYAGLVNPATLTAIPLLVLCLPLRQHTKI
jgi:uncharacterized membrane protein YwaF